MIAVYLAVPVDALDSVAHLSPVFGAPLADGRIVAKVRCAFGDLPPGVDNLGADAAQVRALLAPPDDLETP